MKNLEYLKGRTIKESFEDESGLTINFEDGSVLRTSPGTTTNIYTNEKVFEPYYEFSKDGYFN